MSAFDPKQTLEIVLSAWAMTWRRVFILLLLGLLIGLVVSFRPH
jgi:hypothetical protein